MTTHEHVWSRDGQCIEQGCATRNFGYESEPEGMNYVALAKGIDSIREIVSATVAALVADGFSDDQAREIVAGVWRMMGRDGKEAQR